MARKKWTQLVIAILVALLTLSAAANAQTLLQGGEQDLQDEPADPLALAGDVAQGFYYQGILTEGGRPVNGSRQMEFKLYNASSGGSQVGSTIPKTVSVSSGQFNVALTWGSNQIDGRALWLGVRAKDSGGVWRDLGRKQIRAVPYAMSLYPGAKVIKTSSGNDALHLETTGTDHALRAIAQHGSYDGVYATGGDDGVYGNTTGTSSNNVGVYGYSGATTGSARGGQFYSKSGIGVYAKSDKSNGVQGLGSSDPGHYGGWFKGDSGIYAEEEEDSGLDYAGYFKGDVKITDQLTVDGPATGFFPRPAYNSGWRTIAQGATLVLTHNLEGSADNYVVDVTFKSDLGSYGVNQLFYGGMYTSDPTRHYGAYWRSLTSTSITVYRNNDDVHCDKVRVRIWVYK